MLTSAENLMVGDWVIRNSKPYKIEDCYDLEYFYSFDTNIESINVTKYLLNNISVVINNVTLKVNNKLRVNDKFKIFDADKKICFEIDFKTDKIILNFKSENCSFNKTVKEISLHELQHIFKVLDFEIEIIFDDYVE